MDRPGQYAGTPSNYHSQQGPPSSPSDDGSLHSNDEQGRAATLRRAYKPMPKIPNQSSDSGFYTRPPPPSRGASNSQRPNRVNKQLWSNVADEDTRTGVAPVDTLIPMTMAGSSSTGMQRSLTSTSALPTTIINNTATTNPYITPAPSPPVSSSSPVIGYKTASDPGTVQAGTPSRLRAWMAETLTAEKLDALADLPSSASTAPSDKVVVNKNVPPPATGTTRGIRNLALLNGDIPPQSQQQQFQQKGRSTSVPVYRAQKDYSVPSPTEDRNNIAAKSSAKVHRRPTTNTIRKGLQLIAPKDDSDDGSAYMDDGDGGYDGIQLSWRNLNYVVDTDAGKKQVLFDLNGQAKPGELLAILGGSGAGKSSLMDVLSGRATSGRATGDIRFNNYTSESGWRQKIAYVQQDDIFYEMLTVRETLRYAALLKLPDTMTYKDKMRRVDKVVSETRLTDCLDTKVGDAVFRGISGGEKKRLHIALELLNEPSILILDEPTSGLDAFNAHNVIEAIRTTAVENNRTVMISIHQPRKEILDLFDRIMILAAGRVLFYGSLDTALPYFSHVGFAVPLFMNPADHFLDVSTIDSSSPRNREMSVARISGLTSLWRAQFDSIAFPPYAGLPDRLRSKKSGVLSFNSSSADAATQLQKDAHETQDVKLPELSMFGWLKRAELLTSRQLSVFYRDIGLMIMTPISNTASVLLFFAMWRFLPLTQNGAQARLGLMFYFSVDRYMTWVNSVAIAVPLRLALFTRERTSGMYTGQMLFWAIYIGGFVQALHQFIIVGPAIYLLTGCQRVWSKFWIFFAIYVLICIAGHAHGFFFGAMSRNMAFVLTFAILHLGIYAAYAGYVIDPSSIPKPLIWISYIAPPFWTYTAWSQNELTGLVLTCSPTDTRCLPTGEVLLDILSLRTISVGATVGALIAITVIVSIMASFIFDKTTRPPWANAVAVLREDEIMDTVKRRGTINRQ
ncbi:hypothetical protein SmJEL517_g00656 [Synchytrium microbalum]|uniref:ABC transporter domain-containing protein n=1 Tax=Synchytrium microbalum TaxID=1806994 RepID=A0A507CIN8_9FUNG|nr:uncharacterized protein SmJEL517_g00656 [Synchytrium microbalum]TPX37595.1 hypothetical protein SmJEL517_g00656 [Synchytrium microbalum]